MRGRQARPTDCLSVGFVADLTHRSIYLARAVGRWVAFKQPTDGRDGGAGKKGSCQRGISHARTDR